MSSLDSISQLGLPVTFPEFFPPQLEQYRRAIAECADAPDEYAVAYMLAAAATAAGADVSACVQPSWYVRCNLFVAVIGYKGSGKSTLAERCFAPLIHREEELRHAIAHPTRSCVAEGCDADKDDEDDEDDDDETAGGGYDDGYGDDEDEEFEGAGCASVTPRRLCEGPEQSDPCIVVNDCTGPALLQLLDRNRRQLLVNTDELSGHLARSTGASDRAMWCELYDGRRRRRERATTKAGSATLTSPYVSLIGSIQPELLKCFYNPRGDDGLPDRILLVGDGVMCEAEWPRDADDPLLNSAWATAISRLLQIEEYAEDAIGPQVESRFSAGAREVCKGLLTRLKDIVVVVGIPNAQRGVVKKLLQHAVKLSLLHRVLRWAAGEFGTNGPLGDVDVDDATAACEAVLFFLGRWLLWRKELCGQVAVAAGPIGLSMAPGDEPVLRSLANVAAGAQRTVSIIERLIRLLRVRGSQPVVVATLTALQAMSDVSLDELRGAFGWMVDNGHAEWLDPDCRTVRLVQPASPAERGRSMPIHTAKERAK